MTLPVRTVAATVLALALVLGGCGGGGGSGGPADAFAELDGNGDSALDRDEIAEWVDAGRTFEEWDRDPDSELDRDELRGNAFTRWDANSDGRVDEREWRLGVRRWFPLVDGPRVLRDGDHDGDSELDEDEFVEAFDATIAGQDWAADPVDEERFATLYFELYDVDGDGAVSRLEWVEGQAVFGTDRER